MASPFLHKLDLELIGKEVSRLFDILPELVYVWDLKEYTLSYISPKLIPLLGYSLEDIENMGGTFLPIIVHPELDKYSAEIVEELAKLKVGESYQFIFDFKHKDGSLRKFRSTGAPLTYDEDGSNRKIVLIAEDITQEVAKDNTLQTNLHHISQSEQVFPYGSFDWVIGEPHVTWTEGMFKITGLSSADYPNGLVPDSLYMTFIQESERQALSEAYIKHIQALTPYYEMEHTLIDKAGVAKQIVLRTHLFKQDSQIIMKGSVIDVTQERERESQMALYVEQLQRQQARMTEAESMFKFGTWEADAGNNYIQCSAGMYELLDLPVAENTSTITLKSLYEYIHPEDATQIREFIQASIAAKKDTFEASHRFITATKQLKYTTLRVKCYYNDQQEFLKCVGVTADVTLLENYKRQLEKQLVEVNKSNKELEQFAYVASHDLQEPLRKIIAFGERLEKKYKEALGEEGQFFVARMINASQRMNHLIDGLLTYSRASRQMEAVQNISLQEIVKHVLDDLELKIQEKNAEIVVEPLPQIEAQAVQMQQLFQNLIENALKFSKADSQPIIQISSKFAENQDIEGLKPNLRYYRISIKDNGIGFDPQYAERIFTIFQRLHGRSEYEGTGLGLAICRKIVETHQGIIYANGQIDKGAEFIIYLPITQST